MTICTSHVLREPTTKQCAPRNVRHKESLKCGMCNQAYTVDYEASCTAPLDVAGVLAGAQAYINTEHLSEHRRAEGEIANTSGAA